MEPIRQRLESYGTIVHRNIHKISTDNSRFPSTAAVPASDGSASALASVIVSVIVSVLVSVSVLVLVMLVTFGIRQVTSRNDWYTSGDVTYRLVYHACRIVPSHTYQQEINKLCTKISTGRPQKTEAAVVAASVNLRLLHENQYSSSRRFSQNQSRTGRVRS